MMAKNGRVMRREGLDGWARLCASVLQHAFFRISDLYEKERKGRMNKYDLKTNRSEIKEIKEFLTDGKNEYITYLETKGHTLDSSKIHSILDSFEGGKRCITTMGRAKTPLPIKEK